MTAAELRGSWTASKARLRPPNWMQNQTAQQYWKELQRAFYEKHGRPLTDAEREQMASVCIAWAAYANVASPLFRKLGLD